MKMQKLNCFNLKTHDSLEIFTNIKINKIEEEISIHKREN